MSVILHHMPEITTAVAALPALPPADPTSGTRLPG